MQDKKQIFEEVLDNAKLSAEEYSIIMSKVGSVIERLQSSIDENGFLAQVMLGGSAAKGTIIKGDFDCDVFVRFDMQHMHRDLSGMLEKALAIFDGIERVHGSRDYFNAEIGGIDYEFIPVLEISSPETAQNVTDTSPLHVEWIRSRIENDPSIVDQIILAKIFCKANRLYGAESHIKGFSGHVIDIFIAHYKTFERLLQESRNWLPGHIIDIEMHKTAGQLNSSKLSPLIVIDPIQPDRNAAASLSKEKFLIFKDVAEEFIKRPSIGFFQKTMVKKEDILALASADKEVYAFKVKPLKGKKDIVGSKILKVFEHIEKQLLMNDFIIHDSGWQWDEGDDALMWFVIDKETLSKKKLATGPPLKAKKNILEFRNKHPDAYEKDGRLYAEIKREYTRPSGLFDSLIISDYVSARTESVKQII